jgi:hypothetical protein
MNHKKRLQALEHRTSPTVYEVWRQDSDNEDLFYFGTEWNRRERSLTSDDLTAYSEAHPNVCVIRVIYEKMPLPASRPES